MTETKTATETATETEIPRQAPRQAPSRPTPTLAVPGTGPAAPVEALWADLVRHFPVDDPQAGALAVELTERSAGSAVQDCSDAALVDLVAGWQQLVGVAQAEQARIVRELAVRQANRPSALVAELAAALSWTSTAAHTVVVRAEHLGELPVVDAALRDGSMDLRKVDVLLDELAVLDARAQEPGDPAALAHARREVARVVAEQSYGLTTTQLRRAARRAVIAVDPAATAARARRAVGNRRVSVDWAPDGMAWISAFLPAADAMLVRTVLDAAADATDDALDRRTLHQKRADIFTSVFAAIAETGELPRGGTLSRRRRVRPHIQVTVAATTLLGLDDVPADLTGYGPISAEAARRIAADGTWRRLLTDPATGALIERGTHAYRAGAVLAGHVVARDVTCTFPGCVRPAGAAELDHIAPYRHRPAPDGAAQTVPANLHAACKRHHDLKTEGHWKVARTPGGGVTWTSAAGFTYAVHPQPVLAEPATWHHAPPEPPDPGPPPY
ncbi:HNH endonuclease [Cellulomonas sp. DKR-3]|uniref:HNH endonuclease n=1 Tax=Cellulomonas fulva TaxID=2835530 RepID=A0ABS5TXY7_9CELL|nr:HNH endonuclease signature motif containing protein [Cellulomonas fulva]MBT0993982.1 HNH endonuclease [Cellulomonas fulva]